MNVSKHINRLLSRARPLILVHDSNGINIHAVLQPMRYKNKMYLDSQYTKLGIMYESSFLLISPADYEINELGDLIIDGDELYSFVKTERIYFLGKPAYNWSILRRRRW